MPALPRLVFRMASPMLAAKSECAEMARLLDDCHCGFPPQAWDPRFPLENTKSPPPHPENFGNHSKIQRTAKGASGKGPRQKTSKSVKKIFRHFSTFFRAGQKSSKSAKNIFRHFLIIFARLQFSGPFWGALKNLQFGPLRACPENDQNNCLKCKCFIFAIFQRFAGQARGGAKL